MKGPKPKPLAERFWPKVEPMLDDRGCWEWTGAIHKTQGYGYIGYRGSRPIVAHRAAYEICVGPIPEGLQLDHLCRNRSCVNPNHLEPVTPRENLLRGGGWSGRHARKTLCPNGHPYNMKHSDGARRCRECRNANWRDRYHCKKRAETT